MMKIEELTEDELNSCFIVVQAIGEIYGEFYGEYYKFVEDGVTKFIHRIYNENMTQSAFTILTLEEDNTVSYEQFNVDEDYNIVRAGFEDYIVTYYEDDIVVEDKETGIISSLEFAKRSNGPDFAGFTGRILYTQYNPHTDERCFLTFQQMFNDFNIVYDYNTKNPFIYCIETGVLNSKIKRKSYGRSTFDLEKEPIIFNLITIKEYGLIQFLSKGAYLLQTDDKITRCFRHYHTNKNGVAFTGFPFSRVYKIEEIENDLKIRGFNIEVPKYLVELYNNEHKGMKRYEEIASLMKEFCSSFEDEQKLVLTREVFSNEDEEN